MSFSDEVRYLPVQTFSLASKATRIVNDRPPPRSTLMRHDPAGPSARAEGGQANQAPKANTISRRMGKTPLSGSALESSLIGWPGSHLRPAVGGQVFQNQVHGFRIIGADSF